MAWLYFSQKVKRYFYVIEITKPVLCDKCNKHILINNIVIIQRSWSKKEFKKIFYCEKCLNNNNKRYFDEFITAYVCLDVPENSTLVPDFPPILTNSNATVWSAALNNEGLSSDCSNVQTINKCKLAFKEEEAKEEIEYKDNKRIRNLDKPIDEKKALEFFDSLKQNA